MRKRVVKPNLGIIGEAIINRILKRPFLYVKITDATTIIELRNQVIHAYNNISDETVWAILCKIEIYTLSKDN